MRRFLVFGLLALVIIGCSQDTARMMPAPTTTAEAPVAAAPATPEGPATSDKARVLQAYLDENFSDTTWHRHITGVKVFLSAAWIETDLYSDVNAQEPAARICSGVSSYVFSSIDTLGLGAVTVRAVDGQQLVMRDSVGDPC